MNEKKAEKIYNKILHKIVEPIVGKESTYQNELETAGRKLLGVKFKGVFPSDKIPKLNDLKKYAIINLDRSDQSGSHWVAVALDDGKIYLHDSFARKANKILPALFESGKKVISSDLSDAEQNVDEANCGAHSLAWLLMFEKWGKNPHL